MGRHRGAISGIYDARAMSKVFLFVLLAMWFTMLYGAWRLVCYFGVPALLLATLAVVGFLTMLVQE